MEGMYNHQQKTISSAFKNAQRFSPETALGKYALQQIWWELIENTVFSDSVSFEKYIYML